MKQTKNAGGGAAATTAYNPKPNVVAAWRGASGGSQPASRDDAAKMTIVMNSRLFRAPLTTIVVIGRLAFPASSDDVDEHSQCRLYLAQSTIPRAGLGIYTGIDVGMGEQIAESDIVVPLADQEWHQMGAGELDYNFMWNEYSWELSELTTTDLVDGSALVLGTGCMPNCDFSQINAYEDEEERIYEGLDRARDPGAGAFTGWHNQKMLAQKPIPAGGEIFVDYGEFWFTSRADTQPGMAEVPLQSSYVKADDFLRRFKNISTKFQTSENPSLTRDLWDVIKSIKFSTRSNNALPLTFEDLQAASTIGAAESRRHYTVRSLEWLETNGRCMDNIYPAKSNIHQAGRGAFASRFISKGGLVAPGPLLHIPNRTSLNMYNVNLETGMPFELITTQLITNYCFAHSESTLLLCPYTSPSAYINHNSDHANVRIEWADESTPKHYSFWLDESIDFLKSMAHVGLSVNFVATRDIHPGEEVFLDYGDEWQQAWEEHVRTWKPPPDAESFVSAHEMERDRSAPLRTVEEQQDDPYPSNMAFYCHYQYSPDFGPGPWEFENFWMDLDLYPCKIIERTDGSDGDRGSQITDAFTYAVQFLDESELDAEPGYKAQQLIPAGEEHIVVDVPRWAIHVRDKLYSKDEFLPGAFRHPMMFPDEIFPEPWRNLR